MRKENYIIAVIGGAVNERKTIKQLLEEHNKEGCIIIVELQIPGLEECSIISEKSLISELEECCKAIKKPLISELQEYFKTIEKSEIPRQRFGVTKKENISLKSMKKYVEPYIPKRYYRRG